RITQNPSCLSSPPYKASSSSSYFPYASSKSKSNILFRVFTSTSKLQRSDLYPIHSSSPSSTLVYNQTHIPKYFALPVMKFLSMMISCKACFSKHSQWPPKSFRLRQARELMLGRLRAFAFARLESLCCFNPSLD
ncbi:hypothetical protein S83_042833, partial [Arachis hypogaea]